MEHVIEIKRVQNGIFDAYLDGVKTGWQIVNGSAGLSGRDTRNIYCVVRPNGSHIVIGPLNTAKKLVTETLRKKALK
jgi:hypothetical protein